MLFSNFNLKPNTSKIISLILTLTGIVFILASNYIGAIAIRLAMISLLVFCTVNIKMTYNYLTAKDRLNYLLAIAASLAGLFRPELIMFIVGFLLLYISVPPYINVIKSRDYSDVIVLIIYGLGILFAVYCIINSKAALNTVIKVIGVIFTAAGCISLYDTISDKKPEKDHDSNKTNSFEDSSNM